MFLSVCLFFSLSFTVVVWDLESEINTFVHSFIHSFTTAVNDVNFYTVSRFCTRNQVSEKLLSSASLIVCWSAFRYNPSSELSYLPAPEACTVANE